MADDDASTDKPEGPAEYKLEREHPDNDAAWAKLEEKLKESDEDSD
jgi:hypothetical protein